MRVNPENLLVTESLLEGQVTDGEHASSFYTASLRGVGYFSEPLINKESFFAKNVNRHSLRQEEMRAAAVRTMVAMGQGQIKPEGLRDSYMTTEHYEDEKAAW